MIEPDILFDWTYGWYGYGSWSATFWFVGLEEGGVDSAEDFENRVNVWVESGQPELLDLPEFHRMIGHSEYCCPDAKLQPTWRRLMRTLFVAKAMAPTDRQLRQYQAYQLGSHDGETALIELSPLPARSVTDRWFKRGDVVYSFLDLEELKEDRRNRIVARIEAQKPPIVVCYGEARKWAKYLGLNEHHERLWSGQIGPTTVFATPQGMKVQSNDHWDEIGRIIASKIACVPRSKHGRRVLRPGTRLPLSNLGPMCGYRSSNAADTTLASKSTLSLEGARSHTFPQQAVVWFAVHSEPTRIRKLRLSSCRVTGRRLRNPPRCSHSKEVRYRSS